MLLMPSSMVEFEFDGCEATVKFNHVIDNPFDVANSHNTCAKGFKSAMRKYSKNVWANLFFFLEMAHRYIFLLKDVSGKLMHTTKRKKWFYWLSCSNKKHTSRWCRLEAMQSDPIMIVGTFSYLDHFSSLVDIT